MKKKITMILSLVLVAALLLTACSGGSNGGSSGGSSSGEVSGDGSGVVKDSLVYGIGSEPASLNPSVANDLVSYSVVHQIYNYLIEYKTDGTLVPGLAESWDLSEDGTELTFHLREGVKFHNGDVMTAEDVAFSLNNAIASPHTASISTAMDSAEVIDENTVLLKLKHPFGPVEYIVSHSQMAIVNKAEYEKNPDGYSQNPIGTGPYKFVEWKSGDQIKLTAFEDYYKGVADIKDVTVKIIIEPSTRTIALETGEIDILESPQASDRSTLIGNSNIRYHETEIASSVFVAFNNAEGRFADKKVRQAIAHAVDKESMILGAVDGLGTSLETPMTKDVFGWPEDFKNREYDPEKARQLLAEAGYPDGFSMQIKTMEGATYLKPTEVFQDQLREVGIEAEIITMERGAFLQDVNQNQQYEMCISALSVPYPDADYIYALFHGSLKGIGRNFFNADSPELNKMLDDARLSTDQEERKQIYKEIAEYFIEDPIMVPLYSYMTSVAANKDLNGVMANPLNRFFIYDYSWGN